jgi:hypothetical protein
MLSYRILLILLFACAMARSQTTNSPAADNKPDSSATNLPPSLQALSQVPGIKLSTTPPPPQEPSQATAGIYATKEVPLLKTLLLSLDPTLKVKERTDGDPTSVVCTWPDVAVRFTIQQKWNAPAQRQAMKNWVGKVPEGNTNTPAVGSLLHQMDGTVACIGTVITPHYDSDGKVSSLVLGLAAKLDGYVFSQLAFYGPSGDKIIGVTNAPAQFSAPAKTL